MHYPVDEIITKDRDAFYDGDYTIKLVPLRPFPDPNQNFQNFLKGAFQLGDVELSVRMQESKMILWARTSETGQRIELAEPPRPVLANVEVPHGAVLHFNERPVELVHDDALVRYLRCRGIRHVPRPQPPPPLLAP